MTKMTILRGVSGSGKSTWARQQNAVVVSRDSIRHETLGIDWDGYYAVDKKVLGEREALVSRLQDAMIVALLKAGKDVIVDNTNIQFKFVNALAKLARIHGAEVEVKFFDVSLPVAIAADRHRGEQGGRYVGEAVIRDQYQRLQGTKHFTLDTPPEVKPYHGSVGRPKAFMFDLDGTAYHMNDKRGPYAENVDVDDPDEVVQQIINSVTLATGWVPIAMSGRKERTRELTVHSLNRDGVAFDELFMRANEDNRSDDLVKLDLFNDNVRDNYDVQFVIDDREQVVAMWHRLGIKVINVAGADGGEF